MEERERCYSFILSRTPHETNIASFHGKKALKGSISYDYANHEALDQEIVREELMSSRGTYGPRVDHITGLTQVRLQS
jgi:hypothetical protein